MKEHEHEHDEYGEDPCDVDLYDVMRTIVMGMVMMVSMMIMMMKMWSMRSVMAKLD